MFGAYERPSDNEYVTKEELDERLLELEVHGDGSTVAVDKQTGGATIRCMIPVSAEPIAESNPLFVSVFNASTSDFEISWRDFDVQWKIPGSTWYTADTVVAGTFKLSRADFKTSTYIDIHIASMDDDPEVFWTNNNTAGTVSDSFTDERRMLPVNGVYQVGTHIQRFSRPIGYLSVRKAKVIDWDNLSRPVLNNHFHFVSTGDGIVNMWSPHPKGGNRPGAVEQYTLPSSSFDDFVILGWTQSANTYQTDAYVNRATYDEWRYLGRFRTDSSGNLKGGYVEQLAPRLMGFTGSFTEHGGLTVQVRDGIIYKVTT